MRYLGIVWLMGCVSFSAMAQEGLYAESFEAVSEYGWGNCLTSDLWIVSDYSHSMSGYEHVVYDAAMAISKGILEENHGARVGLMTFNSYFHLVQDPTFDLDEMVDSIALCQNKEAKDGTLTFNALKGVAEAHASMDPHPMSTSPEYKKIILLISDGQDNQLQLSLEQAKRMKEDGWWIYSIYVHREYVNELTRLDDMQFMMNMSGNEDPESMFFDTVYLTDMARYFTETFTCF